MNKVVGEGYFYGLEEVRYYKEKPNDTNHRQLADWFDVPRAIHNIKVRLTMEVID